MPETPFTVATDGHVATVTIDRPDKHNALTMAMWQALADRMGALAESPDAVRVVVLRSTGEKAFSAGADMGEFMGEQTSGGASYATAFQGALTSMTRHPCPVIGMIQGHALGGGCQLALACDLRIASEHAVLGIPAAKIGLALPPEALERLIHIVGIQRAREIMYLGRKYGAADAHRMGLVDWVVAHDQLEDETYALAREIAGNAPLAVRAAKAGLNGAMGHGSWDRARDTDALAPLDALAAACFQSADLQEGLAAFFGKRTPEFKGT